MESAIRSATGALVNIQGATAFVTGANRGLGLAFVQELVASGAQRVYAGMRDPDNFRDAGAAVRPVRVDVNDPQSVEAAAAQCGDVNLLVNNAGIARVMESTLDPGWIDEARAIFETNFFGLVRATQAFAPLIAARGGGAIVNVLSDATWFARPMLSAYAASKSAAWSYTNASRIELAAQRIQVLAMHVGFLDTDLTAGFEFKKTDPRFAARQVLAALQADEAEALVDAGTHTIKNSLSNKRPYYLDVPEIV